MSHVFDSNGGITPARTLIYFSEIILDYSNTSSRFHVASFLTVSFKARPRLKPTQTQPKPTE